MVQNDEPRRYVFGAFTLDVGRGVLLSADSEIRLRRQSFDVLRYLVENPGRLVSKDELQTAIWRNTIVTDGSLTQCLIDVRRALGDHSRQVIRTVPRRGYIFDVPVMPAAAAATAAPVTASAAPVTATAGPRRWFLAVGAAFLVAAAIWSTERIDPSEAISPGAPPNSIAVLPFSDLSEAQDQAYFSDGIAEEILNTLAQSTELRVIARTSSFSFRGKDVDIETIAEMLNVAYVLEGSVRRTGDRVRIRAQLIDASTSALLWSHTFDREAGHVLDVQSEIAAAIAEALYATLSAAAPGAATNAEAFELFLQGHFFHKRRAPGDSARAEDYYRRALAIDPTYGRAWAGLAGTFLVRIYDERQNAPELTAEWKEAVEMTLEHAPELAEGQLRASQYYWHVGDDRRWREHRQRAMELGPNDPLVLAALASANVHAGRLDLAVEQYRRAVELDPLSAVDHANFARQLAAAGRFEEALAEERKALDLNPWLAERYEQNVAYILILQNRLDAALEAVQRWPEGPQRDSALAMVYYALDRSAEADAALSKLESRAESAADAELLLRVAEVHAFRGQPDEAFRWLDRSREQVRGKGRWDRILRSRYLRLSPFLIPLRGDPRWEPVVAWES